MSKYVAGMRIRATWGYDESSKSSIEGTLVQGIARTESLLLRFGNGGNIKFVGINGEKAPMFHGSRVDILYSPPPPRIEEPTKDNAVIIGKHGDDECRFTRIGPPDSPWVCWHLRGWKFSNIKDPILHFPGIEDPK